LGGHVTDGAGAGKHHVLGLRLHLIHIAGHQLDVRAIELFAALVVERRPAHQIHGVADLRRDDIVIGAPAHTAGNIAQFGIEFRRLSGIEDPVERGLENRVVAKRGEDRLPRPRCCYRPSSLHA